MPSLLYDPPLASRCFVLPQVVHFTINFSSRQEPVGLLPPFRTILSLKISSLTLPTSGILPQATGAVHRAATYAIRPETFGRCGCVDGKRCRLICGERMSDGKGDCRSVGSLSCKVRTVFPSCSVLSSGGLCSAGEPGGAWRGTFEVNQTSRLILSMSCTWAKHLQFLRHARGSHLVVELVGVMRAAFAALTFKAALLVRSRRDGRSVRISPVGVI